MEILLLNINRTIVGKANKGMISSKRVSLYHWKEMKSGVKYSLVSFARRPTPSLGGD